MARENPREAAHQSASEYASQKPRGRCGRRPTRAKPSDPTDRAAPRRLPRQGEALGNSRKGAGLPIRNALPGRRDGETDPHEQRGDPPVSAATIGGKHPGFRESAGLRGTVWERRPRPVSEAERGSSPPGKLGATGHARRGGSSPGFRGSRLVTQGCSAAFEGGELARRPKGCEPFTSGQSVRGCTSAGSRETWGSRSEANPLPVVLPRRAAPGTVSQARRKADTGSRTEAWANARGSLASRGARGSEAGAERPRGWCSYVVVSLQMSIGGSAQRSPSPKRIPSKGGWGTR